ncbi:MAG TPA: preprotein translocase subunit SecE [Dehalococcoidia bacterium]|nr:preprotein translocase subunit SecE [Dehalococcoidia bacterium]
MNRRAARRQAPAQQQSKQPRAQLRTGQRSQTAAARKAAAERRPRGFRAILYPEWLRNIVAELRKVTWPTRQETQNLTVVVVTVAIAIGIVLGVFDFVFSWVIERTLL